MPWMDSVINPVTLLLLLCLAAAIWVWNAWGSHRKAPEQELRRLCQGNDSQVERLIQGEMARAPGLARTGAAQRAIERYRRDNR